MKKSLSSILFFLILFNVLFLSNSNSEIIKKIEIIGNERIQDETVEMFSSVSVDDDIDNNKLNYILKELYDSGFFSSVNVKFEKRCFNYRINGKLN